MKVNRHAEDALVALTHKLPVPASVVIARLKNTQLHGSAAIEVARLQYAYGAGSGSNGDTVVVIVRNGVAKTAMLRRSYNQSFTPEAFGVDQVERWSW